MKAIRSLLLGLVCGAAGFLIFSVAPTGPISWLGIPVMSLWGVSGAAIQSFMTKRVAPDQQGQLQGANTSVQSISQLLGPSVFTLTFAYFIGAQAPTLATNVGMAHAIARIALYDLGLDHWTRYPLLVQAVTRDQVQAAARDLIQPEHDRLVVAGPGASELVKGAVK